MVAEQKAEEAYKALLTFCQHKDERTGISLMELENEDSEERRQVRCRRCNQTWGL